LREPWKKLKIKTATESNWISQSEITISLGAMLDSIDADDFFAMINE